jgi:cytochrome c-type biogenesis protein CcmH/NrfG
MKSDSIAFGVAGILFGLIAGWVIGSQQAALRPPVQPPQQAAAPSSDAGANPPAAIVDEAKVAAFKNVIDKEPKNSEARIQLGNLYFDAERYQDAAKWYEDALKLSPKDINVITDLGVCYYNTNQPDKALDQFSRSLKLDPKHTKTLLNVGIVKAFAKQDLDGALDAWQQVVQIAPNSPEGQQAQRGIEGIKSAHPGGPPSQKPGD